MCGKKVVDSLIKHFFITCYTSSQPPGSIVHHTSIRSDIFVMKYEAKGSRVRKLFGTYQATPLQDTILPSEKRARKDWMKAQPIYLYYFIVSQLYELWFENKRGEIIELRASNYDAANYSASIHLLFMQQLQKVSHFLKALSTFEYASFIAANHNCCY